MTRKNLRWILSGMIILILSGCALFYPKRAEVFIWVYVEPENAYTAQDPAYRAFARIDDRGEKEPKIDFRDAKIKVNSVILEPDAQGTFSTGIKADLRLQPGDKVKVTINHPKLGTFRKTLKIPPVVTKLSSQDDIGRYIRGEESSYTLQWNQVESDGYIAKAYFYPTPEGGWTDVYSTQVKENRSVFTGDYLDQLKAQKPYVKFEVNSVKNYLPKNYFEGSIIQIVSPATENISNLPGTDAEK